jgi:sulfatase modifying factor 1
MHAAATMSSPAPDRAWPPEPQRRPPLFPPACAFAWGDDRHGLWIDVDVGGAVQRFRWIEPGEFWMGSPEGEPERDNDEGPRHVVRLTAGFWLADTACAQAVWQAVMGDNPSRLKDDPQNPVEQVSWDDVQDFLGRVKEQFLGMQASLPSEAEWEYACRAGTDTAFNVGDSLSREQANYWHEGLRQRPDRRIPATDRRGQTFRGERLGPVPDARQRLGMVCGWAEGLR